MSIFAVNGKNPVHVWCPSLDTAGIGTATLTDLVGSADGTLTNMDPATDWVVDTAAGGSYALEFDGVNDYVLIPSVNYPAITVAMWVFRPADVPAVFFAKRSNSEYSWDLSRGSPTNWLFARINDNANTASVSGLTTGVWHHLCFTFSEVLIRAFVNGSVGTALSYSTPMSSNSVPLTLGARAMFPGAESFSAMRVDDIRIFDFALSQPEVSVLASRRAITASVGGNPRLINGGLIT